MGSDCPAVMGPVNVGNNFNIHISTESEAETEKLFNALSTGGKVGLPLQKMFWNAYFGMLTDRFGVRWMVRDDYNSKK